MFICHPKLGLHDLNEAVQSLNVPREEKRQRTLERHRGGPYSICAKHMKTAVGAGSESACSMIILHLFRQPIQNHRYEQSTSLEVTRHDPNTSSQSESAGLAMGLA